MRPEQRPRGERPAGARRETREPSFEPTREREPARDQGPRTEPLTEPVVGPSGDPRSPDGRYPEPRYEQARYQQPQYQETQWGAHPRWDGWEQQRRQTPRPEAPPPAGSPPGRRARGGGGATPPGRPKRRLTLVIAAVAAVLVLGGGGAYLMFFRGEAEPVAAPPATAPPEADQAPADQEQPAEEPDPDRAQIGVMPTEENTGVPDGVELRPSEGLTITEDGEVLEGLEIDGCVNIDASDVTIRNSRINADGCPYPVRIGDEAKNALLEDVEIDGGDNPEATAVAFGDYTLRRAYIHGVGDGPRLGDNTVVESSFVHDLATEEGSHNDGMQSTGGSNIVVRGNHVVNEHSQTSAILIGADQGDISDVLVEGNWLDGGGYTIYAGADDDNGYSATDIRIINNKFGRDHSQDRAYELDDEGIEWSGNSYTDGEEITP